MKKLLVAALAVLLSVPAAMAVVNPATLPEFLVASSQLDIKGKKLNSAANAFKAVLVTEDGASYELPSVASAKKASILLPSLAGTDLDLAKVTLKISGGNVAEENAETFIRFLLAPTASFVPNVGNQFSDVSVVNLPATVEAGIAMDGEQGPTGPEGEQGDAGVQGIPGPPGPVGPQGAIGPQGPQGATGPQGARGPKGPRGAIGAQGDTGPAGPAGPAGAPGAPGATGSVGAKGDTGPRGNGAQYHFTLFASRGYNSSFWNNDEYTMKKSGWIKLPNTVYLASGNAGTGWMTLELGQHKACFQGNDGNGTGDNAIKFFKLKKVVYANQVSECYQSGSAAAADDNKIIYAANEHYYVKPNKNDLAKLQVNGDGCDSSPDGSPDDCVYTSVIIPQIVRESKPDAFVEPE